MHILTSLPTAILQFAFTGVLTSHRPASVEYSAPRVVSTSKRVFI